MTEREKRPGFRGRITTGYWVSCGKCQDQRPVVGPRYLTPREQAQLDGWRYTKSHGWVCPKCQEEK